MHSYTSCISSRIIYFVISSSSIPTCLSSYFEFIKVLPPQPYSMQTLNISRVHQECFIFSQSPTLTVVSKLKSTDLIIHKFLSSDLTFSFLMRIHLKAHSFRYSCKCKYINYILIYTYTRNLKSVHPLTSHRLQIPISIQNPTLTLTSPDIAFSPFFQYLPLLCDGFFFLHMETARK